ncbi:exosporium glycoprotein BclB-related protein [Bacillus hominis]|uniref:exosporium glycoprotein BclB-related protein n=1 Tax=Bacillus hominis TaxID=2817478 RepID=UPI0025A28B34|nr:exosporium glycoprotein BclB-related protein [Bacillus hominis]MDM5433411.1 exosporium glycoprotein BclB-related protein [Bacillus hominis]
MKHNDCFDDKDCDPIIITGACCDPKTVCPSNSQLQELQSILMDLTKAISTFLTTPNASTAPLIALFTKLSALLNSLIPTAEVDYLKQLIQSILAVLTSMTPNKAQLIVLLQQFYSALADYFFSIKACFAPSILRFLFNLLTQLIIVTSGPGATERGAIIPLASGTPLALTSLGSGIADIGGLVGFGSSAPTITALGTSINLTGPVGAGGLGLLNMAFSVPREGVITSIAAFFSTTVELDIGVGGSATIKAQLYESPGPNNIFTPIPGAVVTLGPPLSDGAIVGTIRNNITTGLEIPVTPQTRLLMVYSITTSGLTVAAAVVGYASAGINIL